ncbi:MAG: GMC family oxidoreductase [Chloroflexota bacterium]|nr:MAG: GMC family oxidoreductase [Chloroflexota bacterium]
MKADVCILGMGAVGATASHVLAKAGLKVVVLEAGPNIGSVDARPDELVAAYARASYGRKFNQEALTWRPNPTAPTVPATYSLGRMVNGVGGSTQIYGTWMRRFQPHDFRVRTSTIERYGMDALPPGSNVVDWPITHDDLEPYFGRVEQMMGIAGIPGNVRGEPLPGGNPFEGYRSEGLPLPPPARTPTGLMFAKACRGLGYHPYPVPASINTEPYDGRPACTSCGWCTFYVCHNDSKTTAENGFARKALATGNVDLRLGCRVVEIERQGNRVTAFVDVDADGQRQRVEADRFILGAYTYENVRLLLLSGIGNEHGRVGRDYFTKMFWSVMGLFPDEQLNRFIAPAARGDLIDDFVGDNFDHSGLGFIRGATIACEEQLQPIAAARAALPPGVPAWGSAYKEHLVRNWNSIADLRIQPETLAYDDAFLDLDPHGRDRSGLGLPVVRVTWDIHENERRMLDYLGEKAQAILREMGAANVWTGPRFTGVGSAHDMGGCRMGEDPRRSVVDPDLRVHSMANLYVMGGCVFPTGGGLNPTLTIQALVWRAAERIAA